MWGGEEGLHSDLKVSWDIQTANLTQTGNQPLILSLLKEACLPSTVLVLLPLPQETLLEGAGNDNDLEGESSHSSSALSTASLTL